MLKDPFASFEFAETFQVNVGVNESADISHKMGLFTLKSLHMRFHFVSSYLYSVDGLRDLSRLIQR